MQVRQDGEHLFVDLVRAINESGCKASDDDVSTTGGAIQTAIYVIDRLKDELDQVKDLLSSI